MSRQAALQLLPDHLIELCLEEAGLAGCAAASCASRSLQTVAQDRFQKLTSLSEQDFPRLRLLEAWQLRCSISRVPIVNLSPVLTRLFDHLGEGLCSAARHGGALRSISLRLPSHCVHQPAALQHEAKYHQEVLSDREARDWLQGAADPPELPGAGIVDPAARTPRGALGLLLASCAELRALRLVNVPSSWVGLDLHAWQALATTCGRLQRLSIGFEGGEECIQDEPGSWYSSQLTDMALQMVAQCCTELRDLELLRCSRVGNLGLKAVAASCRGLRRLRLHDCPMVSERGLVQLAERCTALESLDVVAAPIAPVPNLLWWPQAAAGSCQLGFAALFTFAANCPNLQEISISEECLVEPVLDDLCVSTLLEGCRSLRKLALAQVQVSDRAMFVAASRSAQLQELRLEHTWVTDCGLAAVLQGCRQLRCLHVAARSSLLPAAGLLRPYPGLSGRAPVSDCLLAAIARHSPGLEELHVSGTHAVTDAGLHQLAAVAKDKLAGLQSLGLDHVGASAVGLAALLARCPGLQRLSCAGLQGSQQMPAFTADAAMAVAARCCRALTSLSAPYSCISDEGAASLASCASLTQVNLSFSFLITDMGLVRMAQGLGSKLQRLELFKVPALSYAGVMAVLQLAPALRHLNVGGCSDLHDFGLDRVLHNVLTQQPLQQLSISLACPSLV